MADIARAAGVSVGTVSNALNGRRSQTAAATIERVLETAERLGYRGNSAAAALRTGQHGVIGLHLPRMVRALSFYMDFALGVEEAAAAEGLDLMLVTADRPTRINRVKVDGAIVVDWTPELSGPAMLQKAGMPVVAAGGIPESGGAPDCTVRVKYAHYVEEIVRVAGESGATRAVMLAPDANFQSDWARMTQKSFADSAGKLGIDHMIVPISVTASRDELIETANEAVKGGPVDFVLVGPQRFAGMLNSKFGWGNRHSSIPLLASCAGDPITELSSAEITSIDANPHAFGKRCVAALREVIADPKASHDVVLEHPANISWASHWRGVNHCQGQPVTR